MAAVRAEDAPGVADAEIDNIDELDVEDVVEVGEGQSDEIDTVEEAESSHSSDEIVEVESLDVEDQAVPADDAVVGEELDESDIEEIVVDEVEVEASSEGAFEPDIEAIDDGDDVVDTVDP